MKKIQKYNIVNITKLKAGPETSLPGKSVFLWTSHTMLRIASNISEGYTHDIVMEGEDY